MNFEQRWTASNWYVAIVDFQYSLSLNKYLTIIPWVHVGYEMVANEARSAELAIIIIQKCRQNIKNNSSCKNNNFQLVFNFEQMRTVTIFGEHGIMAHIP